MDNTKLINLISQICEIIKDISYEQASTPQSYSSWYAETVDKIKSIQKELKSFS